MKIQTVFRVLLAMLLVVITYLSFTSRPYRILEDFWDKSNHLVAFATLALALDFSFPRSGYGLVKILPLFGYGLLIELVQSRLAYRYFELADLLADCVGLLIYGVSLPVLRKLPFLRRRWSV
jgi:VanZ family protein